MKINTTALLITVGAVFTAVMFAIVALVIFAPPQADTTTLIPVILTGMTNLIIAAGALAKANAAASTAADINGTVKELANGGMDAKIRAGFADVAADHMVKSDTATQQQLEADRQRRDEMAVANGDHEAG